MHYIIKCANPRGNSAGCFKPTWRNWQTRTVQVRVPQGLWVRLPPSVPFSLQAGMAYRLCTSLPSWLEGFDPPYPLHFFMVGFPSGQRGQTVNLLARLSMVRIHLPPPFLTSERQQSLPFFTIYAFNSRKSSYIKSNQSVGSKSWESAKWIQIFTASN